MARAFIVVIAFCLSLASCTQRSICPAYQSAYIYDKDALRKKFSYFLEDSTPKLFAASKNKFLVAEPTTYRKKLRSMQSVEMKPVPVLVPDSLLNADSVSLADLDRAARSVIDSTFIEEVPGTEPAIVEDSVYVISKDKELRLLKYNGADSLVFDPAVGKYVSQKPEYYVKDVRLNIEQDNYMWYLRDNLVLPDVRLARNAQAAGKENKIKQKSAKKKKGKGFFKNLFKKKKKTPKDSTAVPQKEEFDFINTDSLKLEDPQTRGPETKKGFFSPRKSPTTAEEQGDIALTEISDKKKKPKIHEAQASRKKEEAVEVVISKQ
ncbi:MAG: hypothetical protein ABIR06_05150 [Cyclobacteriaceae bacterium]